MTTFSFSPFPLLTTERLLLRAISLQDAEALSRLRSDAEVNKYIDRAGIWDIAATQGFIQKIMDGVARNESVYWIITLKDSNDLIGTAGLWNLSPEKSSAEIGYELLPAHQGHGYMQEAVRAVIDFGVEKMCLQVIEASVQKGNTASIRLLEKTGFQQKMDVVDEVYLEFELPLKK